MSNESPRIVLVGGGGHAGDVLDALAFDPRIGDPIHRSVADEVPGFVSGVESPRDQRGDSRSASPGAIVVAVVADEFIDTERFTRHCESLLPFAALDGGADSPSAGAPAGEETVRSATHFVMAVGWPSVRRQLLERVTATSIGTTLRPYPVRHPRAEVGPHAILGEGAVVLAGAHVSSTARLGRHVHVSYLAAVGHDCRVGDFVTVMPAAVVGGSVSIGAGTTIGANATVLEGVRIGHDVMVGAGAVVISDVPDGVTVVGNPARILSGEGASTA